jgi:YHS domain-containing protein
LRATPDRELNVSGQLPFSKTAAAPGPTGVPRARLYAMRVSRPAADLVLREGTAAGKVLWPVAMCGGGRNVLSRTSPSVRPRNSPGEDLMSKRIIALIVLVVSLCAVSFNASAGPQFTVALQGYDTVSFFDAATPKKGDTMHAVHWNGATWLFANEANANRFKAEPAKYAPQFDGYCSFAASRGYIAPADALTGVVVNGKLYLNFNQEVKRMWAEDRAENIRKGEENWPKLNNF